MPLLFVSKKIQKKLKSRDMRLGFVSKEKKKFKKKPKSQTLRLNSERVVSLITEMPLKTKLWKLKTPKMCFWFL